MTPSDPTPADAKCDRCGFVLLDDGTLWGSRFAATVPCNRCLDPHAAALIGDHDPRIPRPEEAPDE